MLDHIQFTLIHGLNVLGSYAVLFFTALDFTFITRHIHNWALFLLWPSLFIFSGAISPLFLSSKLDTFWPGGLVFQCHIFIAFSYCLRSSCGKNTGVVCHSLLQWTTFCQNSPLWSIHFLWPCKAWLTASLSYTSPFAMTRLWSMKRDGTFSYTYFDLF